MLEDGKGIKKVNKKTKKGKNNKKKRTKNTVINRFYYKKDRLNQLRGFCAVVQHDCSATKAGEALHLESATIGQQIKALEQQLNIELFDRNYTNRLVITEAGKKFYEMALPAVQNVDGVFQNFMKGLENERNNVLNIASLDVVITKMIPYLVKFKKDNPKIKISTFNISKEEAFNKLKNHEIDLALYPCDFGEECQIELEKKFIINYLEYWILYKGHPLENVDEKDITQQQIANYPFVVLDDCIYMKSFENFVKNYNIKSPITFRYGGLDIIKTMVKTKTCISLINGSYVNEKDFKELVFKNTMATMPVMSYFLFTCKNFEMKEISNKFIKIVEKNKENIFH